MDSVHVRMLGGFLIRWEDREVTVSARSRKLYLLLAFLIWKREDPVSYRELSDLLWNQPRPDAASLNALKAILHRARSLLDQLWEGAGRSLLLSREGGVSGTRSSLSPWTRMSLSACAGTVSKRPWRCIRETSFPP